MPFIFGADQRLEVELHARLRGRRTPSTRLSVKTARSATAIVRTIKNPWTVKADHQLHEGLYMKLWRVSTRTSLAHGAQESDEFGCRAGRTSGCDRGVPLVRPSRLTMRPSDEVGSGLFFEFERVSGEIATRHVTHRRQPRRVHDEPAHHVERSASSS